ncbi:MAG: glutathione S-transferase N-terminal domain-containing protein [Deltaproteobacteria bacterium]|nr:MAG: glutathione S-transferase N-terminal domain-containing protein [Deltaproteobacteria bacterium]
MPDVGGFYRVYGMTQSYFTRKMTGYLDYKCIPYRFRGFAGANPEARAAGWPGGIPPLETPDGAYMWDSTAMIHYLERLHPDPAVLPPDRVARFLCYALEDALDEWLYRPAVGSRWFIEENARVGGFELARDVTREAPLTGQQAFDMVRGYVTATCAPFGATAENIQAWIDEVLRPWLRVLGAHLAQRPYLFGARPSLADFAIFGGNAAHFINDPVCRRWVDADGPALVQHTHRLLEPEDQEFGDFSAEGDVPETLVAVLADLGRLYLPWVSRATARGRAELVFASGPRVEIAATPFLEEARRVLLARYVELRCEALDAVLERAGILSYFADFAQQAGRVPGYDAPPQPARNRPFGPPGEAEA